MIRSIRLTNFQSHKNSFLEFAEGVNFIVGNSDSGKTAIIRAIRLVAKNRPSGDDIRSHWGGRTMVEITTDKDVITRIKDKENEYILNDLKFKAFATDVPKEISDALDFNENNISYQLDSPFLLSLSAGDVAQHWNRIAKLDAIDKATSSVNSSIRELTADIKYKESQEKVLAEELSKFDDLPEIESAVAGLEKLEKDLLAVESKYDKLRGIAANLRLNAISLEKQSGILKMEKPIDDILKLINDRNAKMISFDRLVDIYDSFTDIDARLIMHGRKIDVEPIVDNLLTLYADKTKKDAELAKLNKVVSSIKSIDVSIADKNRIVDAESKVLEILGLINEFKVVKDAHKKLSDQLSLLKGIQVRIVNGNAFIALKTDELNKAMPVGSLCKLCGQKITINHEI